MTIALISMSGLGIKLSDMIVSVGRSDLFLCLLLSMIICIILGMGLPTTAAYVLAAAVMVPALIILKAGAAVTKEELQSYVAAESSTIKAPRYVQFVESIPKNSVGKLDLPRIRELYARSSDT